MKKVEFLAAFEEVLEADPDTITESQKLADLDGWDSLTIMAFIAMVDEKFGMNIPPPEIVNAKTVGDLVVLLGDSISG
ncbi:acyl carrier protein [Desulfofustis glycolicus]|uniref:Phosphopantetheine attachment site n=1 Tax=Desulfofustis glycolicus DSM 9705 TaxID=1121409 RepID=A0A1M5VPR0_9BACT|nr:acyl carrier protein [Desulfofustis glycolicus]SHH77217.1 Phosphopantetheine attachment site [Desulfofustis glycolicus DSM 9705]